MFDSRIKDRRFKPKWDTTLKKRQQSSDNKPKNKEPDAKETEKRGLQMTYNIGKDEIIWERIYGTDERLHYLITSDKRRDVYFLYSVDKDKTVHKVGKAKTTPELWKKHLGGKVK